MNFNHTSQHFCCISRFVNSLDRSATIFRNNFKYLKNISIIKRKMIESNNKHLFTISNTSNISTNSIVLNEVRSNNINFAYSFRPIYFFSRAFGLLPFSLIFDSNGDIQKARVSIFDGLWFKVSVSLYLLMAFICYQNIELLQDQNQSPILVIGDALFLIFGLIYDAVSIVFDMLNRNKLVDILKMLTAFDNEV